jgi:predicted phosphodiesterase
MKILALSDIHNNVPAVRKLRAQETNDYDAVAVAGDIGAKRADEIFAILRSFECPIVFVHGNWDRMGEDADFGPRADLVHLRLVKLGAWTFTGYSFAGSLPPPRRARSPAEYAGQCRAIIAQSIRKAGLEPRRCVLISHDRAAHLEKDLPGLRLHLFGHVHTFDVAERAGTTYVNTSALDRVLAVAGTDGAQRYVNAGNYAVITLGRDGEVSVECRLLQRNYTAWRVLGRHSSLKGPPPDELLIPEDAAFAGQSAA